MDLRVAFADIRVGGGSRHVGERSGRVPPQRYRETKAWQWREGVVGLEGKKRERGESEHGIGGGGGTEVSRRESVRESCGGHVNVNLIDHPL